jgi:hypothetical protein
MIRTGPIVLVTLLIATAAAATPVSLTTISGSTRDGLLVGLANGKVTVDVEGVGEIEKPLGEVVGLTFRVPTTTPPGGAASPAAEEDDAAVTISLADGDRLVGLLVDGSEDTVTLKSAILGRVTVSLDAIETIRFRKAGEVARRSRPHANRDSLTYRAGDTLTGWVASFGKGEVRVDCVVADDYRVTFGEIAAIHLHQDAPESPTGLLARLTLTDGSLITARALKLAEGRLSFRPVLAGTAGDDASWSLPIESVSHVTVRGGAYVHLSDIPDWSAVVVPFFPPADPMLDPSEWLAPHRDRAFGGTPLTLGKRTFMKGVGVVSGTIIRVELKGGYRAFRAVVGVDRIAGPRGSVTFEVILDGKSRWKSPVLRAGSPPLMVPAQNLRGAKVLELRVGYGEESGADVQDLADWAEAILIK